MQHVDVVMVRQETNRALAVDIIAVLPGTRLSCIVRNNGVWEVWTGVNNMNLPRARWLGTHIELHDNGMVRTVTVRADEADEERIIREHD